MPKRKPTPASVNVPVTSVSPSSQLSSADADVLNSQACIKAARQQFEAAKANLLQAEANNVKAQNDLVRYKQLVEKQEISQQQYDQAVAAAKAGSASVEAARASAMRLMLRFAQAEGRLAQAEANQRSAGTAPRQVSIVRARTESAVAAAALKKAGLDQAQLNLSYTKVVAPVTGVVSNRTVEVGQNVQAGQAMMNLIPLDDSGAPYFLRSRPDTFRVFLYAPRQEKVRRLIAGGVTLEEAGDLVDTVDRERMAFIKHYFNADWPTRSLYHMMINTIVGDEKVVATILETMSLLQGSSPVPEAAMSGLSSK